MINQKNLESGRSMIEMLGVLAIIGVLSVGGIAGYSKAMLKYKTNKTIDLITQLTSNIRIAFGNQRNYNDLINQTVMTAYNIVPNEMYTADARNQKGNTELKYQTPWGDDAYIHTSKKTDQDGSYPRAFTIEFQNIPAGACSELLLVDWGGSAGGGLISINTSTENNSAQINTAADDDHENDCTTNVGNKKFCVFDGGFPITPAQAVTACGNNTTNVLWKFY